ncbi:hypothetical protein PAMP_013381 [Pampus punctatissimus]
MTTWAVLTRVHFSVSVAIQQQSCEGQKRKALQMNLYSSFGNLMETWITEGNPCFDSEWIGNHDEDSPVSFDIGTNLCSESVDSGVETASSDTCFPASASQSPVFASPVPLSSSSSSPHICPSRAQQESTVLHLKVEQALQMDDSKRPKDISEPVTVDKLHRLLPRASFLSKRHISGLVRGQRSQSFDLRRTVHPSVPVRQMSEKHRRPLSMSYDKQPVQTRSQDLGEEVRTGLSPGLKYLEQVCQMLEEIARQQMHNRALQMEINALQEHQDTQVPDTCQCDCKALEDDLSSCQRLENEVEEHVSSEPQQKKHHPYRHFRQRSASDTTIATLHSRKLKADCRGQHLSTYDLLKKEAGDHEKQVESIQT